MIIAILTVAAVAILALVAFIANRPTHFRVTRSTTIPAHASVLFAEVNDLHRWETWSPWARLDPNSKSVYAGPESGIGSSMHWSGSNKVGEGTMTITDSRPDQLVQLRLEFLKPFQATNAAEFTFEPKGEVTLVTWSMSGTNNFIGKAVGLFINYDKMCGDMFEKGLANLRAVTEELPLHR